jgi:hypothetical protein
MFSLASPSMASLATAEGVSSALLLSSLCIVLSLIVGLESAVFTCERSEQGRVKGGSSSSSSSAAAAAAAAAETQRVAGRWGITGFRSSSTFFA